MQYAGMHLERFTGIVADHDRLRLRLGLAPRLPLAAKRYACQTRYDACHVIHWPRRFAGGGASCGQSFCTSRLLVLTLRGVAPPKNVLLLTVSHHEAIRLSNNVANIVECDLLARRNLNFGSESIQSVWKSGPGGSHKDEPC